MRKLLTLAAMGCLLTVQPLFAADTALVEKLKAQRSAIALDNGKLSGPGAELLRQAGLDSQFVMIGEDHGINEIAQFSAAYFEQLARSGGFRHLVVENGPAVAAALNAALKTPAPLAAIAAFDRSYPFSTAFYNLKPEAEFLLRVAQAAGPGFQLSGIDQELMGASKYLLEQMARVAAGQPAKQAIAALQRQEVAFYQQAAASGNPEQLFMMSVKLDALTALRKLLAAPRDGKALAMLDALLESRSIYGKNMAPGQGFASNVERGRLMKRLLSAQLQQDPSQKILMKIGGFHVYRGPSPLGSREIGNYLAEVAEARGSRSLHVLVLAVEGKQAAFGGVNKPQQVVPVDKIDAASALSGLLPVVAAMEGAPGWSVFDLRPLAPSFKALSAGDAEVQRLLLGYDFVVLIPSGSAAAPL